MPPAGFKTLPHSLTLSLLLSDRGLGLLVSLQGVSLSLSLVLSVAPSLSVFLLPCFVYHLLVVIDFPRWPYDSNLVLQSPALDVEAAASIYINLHLLRKTSQIWIGLVFYADTSNNDKKKQPRTII